MIDIKDRKIYFFSDTHFGHKNIMKYEPTRIGATASYIIKTLFSNLPTEEQNVLIDEKTKEIESVLFSNNPDKNAINEILEWHNKMIIHNWNDKVRDDDIVFFLGDFAFKDKTSAQEIGRQLKGHKIILLGNHDGRKHYGAGNGALTGLTKFDPVLEAHFKSCGFEHVLFCPTVLKGGFLICHEPPTYITEAYPLYVIYGHVHSSELFKTETEHSLCVCCERHGFTPCESEVLNNYDPTTIN